jgi:hypothetical protein
MFAGSHPPEAVGFLDEKILSTPSFRGEVKPSVPCRSFAACKRSQNIKCKAAYRQNFRTFLAHSSTFRRWVLSRGDTRGEAWWQKLEIFLTLLVPMCSIIIIKYIHSSNTSTTFYKLSTGYMFQPSWAIIRPYI